MSISDAQIRTEVPAPCEVRRDAVAHALRWHRPLMLLAVVCVVVAALAAAGLLLDDRMVLGAPVWLKPVKFAVSFALYTVSLAWMISLSGRFTRLLWWAGTVSAVFSIAELGLIFMQAGRGQQSHFNNSTAFDTAVYTAMAVAVGVIWTATLVVAVVLLFQPLADAATRWAIRLGLLVSLVGMAIGVLMVLPTPEQEAQDSAGIDVAIEGAHSVGVPDGGPGLPVTGWSTTGGDLRVAHFVGIHALQFIPLIAVLLITQAGRWAVLRDSRIRARLVGVGAAGYTGAVALLTWQALRGESLLHPGGASIVAAAALAATIGAATAAVLRTSPRSR